MKTFRFFAFSTLILLASRDTITYGHGGEDHGGGGTGGGPRNWEELWWAWEFEPWVVVPLVLSAWLYGRGLRRFWSKAGVGRGIRVSDALSYWVGWFCLVIALVSPIHPWGSVLFSAHMAQHEILMLLAAPLLVLGKPLIAFLNGLPAGWARRFVRWGNSFWWRPVWRTINHPFVAWLIHAVILWVWHIPALFEATIDDEFIHAIQHLSFLLSALLFWWAILKGPQRAMRYGAAVLYIFTTALHSGALGALLTFATSVWYPAYADTTGFWGLTALEDQQLGGLIMWVPACLVYVFAGILLFARWIQASEERTRRREEYGVVSGKP